MRSRKLARLLMLGLVLLAASSVALARPVYSIWIERDLKECEIIVIGTVTDVKAEKESDRPMPGAYVNGKPVVEKVEVQMVSYRAELVVKGAIKEGQEYTFQHYRLVERLPIRYSSHFFPFKPEMTYLLFLKRSDTGLLEYAAPETEPTTFDSETLSKIRSLHRHEEPAQWIINMLVLRLEAGQPGMNRTIWMLNGSSTFNEKVQDKAFRDRVVKALLPIVKDPKGKSDVGAAYAMLGRLNETSVIPDIVEFICRKEQTWEFKTNAINWLQGFSPPEQIDALEEIIAKSPHANVVRYARTQLDAAKRQKAYHERVERMRRTTAEMRGERLVTGNLLSRKVTFEIIDARLDETVGFLKTLTKLDVVLDLPESDEKRRSTLIALEGDDITVKDAVLGVAHQAGLEAGQVGRSIHIAAPEELKRLGAKPLTDASFVEALQLE